jgi:integrase
MEERRASIVGRAVGAGIGALLAGVLFAYLALGLTPSMTFHQLRHTAATLLLLKNVNPKVVSEMLGHANIAVTLDTYSHVLPNMQSSAVATMEEAFS